MDRNQNNQQSNSSENIISLVWAKYFPYWPLYLILLLIFLGGTWLYLKKTTPLYESSATILIKDEKKGSDDAPVMESLNLLTTKKIVENEIEVLTSRSLMEEVALNLKLYAPVYKKGKWRDSAAYSFSPIRIQAKEPESLVENPKIFFTFDSTKQEVQIDKATYPVNLWVNTPYGELKFTLSNNKKHYQNGTLFFSLNNAKKTVIGLMGRFSATASSKLTTVIDLTFRDEDALMSEDVLNQLLFAYKRASINDKNALASNTLSFVQERLDFVGRHLDSIERKIQQYKAEKGAVDIGSQGRIFLENVSSNDKKLGDINVQLAALEQIQKYVESKDNNGGIVPSMLDNSNPLLSTLLQKLYDAELEKEKIKKLSGENSPTMISLNDQIQKIKPSLAENIQSQRKSLEAAKVVLSATNNSYFSMLQSIPQKEKDLVEISRQQNIENNIYSFLLQKREEAALSNSSTVADNRIIDKAQSSLFPVSPNKKLIYMVTMIVAIIIGVTAVTAKELFNKNILYRDEIESFTTQPVIAEIAFDKSKEPLVIQNGTTSIVAEQFRKLRATIGFNGLELQKKKILVTSTVSGDGKSFITANLGLALAMAGKKTLLIEADLSNPTLSKKLKIKEEIGLSEYLSSNADLKKIVKQTAVSANLFVIPSGSLPQNPSELLLNGKMKALLDAVSETYDYILLDTAPVGPISDAYAIAPLCDTTLYIVRHAHTPKAAIRRLDQANSINELKNLLIVFNGVRLKGFTKYSYGNTQTYKYAYKGA